MKVKDYIDDAQNGTKIIINETVFDAEGDISADVFIGVVGEFAKCPYRDKEVRYFRILGSALELNI